MKILNTEEIKQVANALCMTEQDAKEVTDIFANIYQNEQDGKHGWKVGMPLESADDYIREWENHWHREANWQEYYNYEKENCWYDYDKPEIILKSVETLKDDVQNYIAYELSSGMIIIVG